MMFFAATLRHVIRFTDSCYVTLRVAAALREERFAMSAAMLMLFCRATHDAADVAPYAMTADARDTLDAAQGE